jgi:hypothetical protein
LKGDWSGSSNPFTMRLEYSNDQSQLLQLSALPADWETQTLCVPPEALGFVSRFVFAFGVNCSDGYRDYFVDDIELVSDPVNCP